MFTRLLFPASYLSLLKTGPQAFSHYPQEKHFTSIKKGPQVIDKDKFRFEMFILLIEISPAFSRK